MDTLKSSLDMRKKNHNYALIGDIVTRIFEIATPEECEQLKQSMHQYNPTPNIHRNFIPSALIPKFAETHGVTMSYLITGHDPGTPGGTRILDWSVQHFQEIAKDLSTEEIGNLKRFLSFFCVTPADFDVDKTYSGKRYLQLTESFFDRAKNIFLLFPCQGETRKSLKIPKDITEYYNLPYDNFYRNFDSAELKNKDLGFRSYSVSRLFKPNEPNIYSMLRVDPCCVLALSDAIGTTPCLFFDWKPIGMYTNDPIMDDLISDFLCIPLDMRVYVLNILNTKPIEFL